MHRILIAALERAAPDRGPGYIDEIVALGQIKTDPEFGDFVELDDVAYASLLAKHSPGVALGACGPGCHLKKTLSWWGFAEESGCGCEAFAATMDAWGPTGCRRRLDIDIMPHLRAKAAERGVLFVPPAVRAIVLRAIRRAERELKAVTERSRQQTPPRSPS